MKYDRCWILSKLNRPSADLRTSVDPVGEIKMNEVYLPFYKERRSRMRYKVLNRETVLLLLDEFKKSIQNQKIEETDSTSELLRKLYNESGISTIDALKEGLLNLSYVELDLENVEF